MKKVLKLGGSSEGSFAVDGQRICGLCEQAPRARFRYAVQYIEYASDVVTQLGKGRLTN